MDTTRRNFLKKAGAGSLASLISSSEGEREIFYPRRSNT